LDSKIAESEKRPALALHLERLPHGPGVLELVGSPRRRIALYVLIVSIYLVGVIVGTF
jgi:hypothetical protein